MPATLNSGGVEMADILTKIEKELKSEFEHTKRILSFEEFVRLVETNPKQHTRNASTYLLDAIEYFGSKEVSYFGQNVTHYKIFDLDFASNDASQSSSHDRYRVVGQYDAQAQIVRSLKNASREGLSHKLILLHGPNGSAKSSLVQCLIRGLEYYSEKTEGAQYKFSWIFPVDKVLKGGKGLGLSQTYSNNTETSGSYAFLGDEDIAARMHCEMKDHPLLLIPKPQRAEFLSHILKKDLTTLKRILPEYILHGDLCHKCKQVFDALLSSYKGDLKRVLMHAQIERFYFSKRYRIGAVTIEPQMHVDAQARQITMDRSLAFLPASLHGLSLYELSGDLVDANRGIVEYADLLKRPIDTFKYLLMACETGNINVGPSIAYLDSVLIGSTNELQLDAFKEFPDFTSFKARIELIRVPYLTQVHLEKSIYDFNIARIAGEKHLSPHTTFVISLWSVLTRLKKPNALSYQPQLTNAISSMTPLEKAKLYDTGEVPAHLNNEERKLLRASIKKLRDEYAHVPYYEGRIGASAREIKSILFDAAQSPEYECLSPLAVFKEVEDFVKRRASEYDFLRQDIKDGYHDNFEFINQVRREYLQRLDQEVREATGVFAPTQYEDFVKRYIQHVSVYLKKEKIKNPITGQMTAADSALIEEFETIVGAPSIASDKETFRHNVISQIGAFALDHPNQPVDYKKVFPDFIRRLDDHYFGSQKDQLNRIARAIALQTVERDNQTAAENTTFEDSKLAASTVDKMVHQFHYCDACARRSIMYLVKLRYS
jgi:serine protein kinase